ncbi:MAG TPA: hypothetical protein VG326_10260 [Tepidisphaeraceae bacterium]|jgi:hypothetical protein|nr:hypothetical protein [Tepidisphaeraceae bacterium]
MAARSILIVFICALTSIAIPRAGRSDDSKPAPAKKVIVAGIYCDRKDNKADTLTFMADGEDEPQQYSLEGADKKTLDAMKNIFPECRMRIAYKQDGDVRKIIGVEKIIGRPTGVFIGEVMFVRDNFWVAVKPKNGPPDAFALGSDPNKGGPIVETLKSLQKGDVVAIRFTTDFERRRIADLQKKGEKK